MRIGLFLKYDREVVKWSENREIPDLGGGLTGMYTAAVVLLSIFFDATTLFFHFPCCRF